MGLRLARHVVDWYMSLASRTGRQENEIHFFGREPFCAPEILDLVIHLARIRAKATEHTVRFEITTNGSFDVKRCQWAADNMDTLVLSFDGPVDQDSCRTLRFDLSWRRRAYPGLGDTTKGHRICTKQSPPLPHDYREQWHPVGASTRLDSPQHRQLEHLF
jgi:hypothetical protein